MEHGSKEEVIRIDSHVHALPERRLRGLMRWIKRGYPDHPVDPDITADGVVEDLRRCGASHFFNLVYPLKDEETGPLNLWNIEFCRKTPGAIPFASLHQDTSDKARLAERAIEDGFAGFKFHPFVQGFDPWDTRMDPLYGAMQEAGRPVMLHTGFEEFYQLKMPVSELEGLLARFPRLCFVFVHMAFPELEWAFQMQDEYPDLYLDATNVLSCFRPEFEPFAVAMAGRKDIKDVLVREIEEHCRRVMYGSDHPAGMGALKDIYADLDNMPVSEQVKQTIAKTTPRAFIERFLQELDWAESLQQPS